jgi:hypothetical protein
MHRSSGVVIAGLLCAGLLAGCSAKVSLGNPQISVATLDHNVAQQLAKVRHQPVPNVSCPRPLDAVVGAKTQCVLTAQGSTTRYAVSVVVTSVSNGTAHFTAQVAEHPEG